MNFRWIYEAISEFMINMLVSLLPFIIGVIVMLYSGKFNYTLNVAIFKIVERGELIIYSSTLMAPIAYAVLRDPPVKFKKIFGLFCLTIIIIGCITYTTGYMSDFSPGIIDFSYYIFFSSILAFLILVLVEQRVKLGESAPQIQQRNSQSLLQSYKRHRGIN